MNSDISINRFRDTLNIVAKEGRHLIYSIGRLKSHTINNSWVLGLEDNPEQAEQLEAFISRFGRMQDTIADKLLPRWLVALAEKPGSQIEVLQRAERLEVLANVETWLEARKLRNRLVHEYMEDPDSFSKDLLLAINYCNTLIECYNQLREFALHRMAIDEADLSNRLDIYS